MRSTDTEAAWAAGFLVADGSIGINKSGLGTNRGQTWTLKVRAANADLAPLRLLKRVFGGSVWTITPQAHQTLQHYEWCVQGTAARNTITRVFPFLTGRHRWLAALLMLFPHYTRGTKRASGYTKEEQRRRGEVVAWMRQAIKTHL